VASVVDDRNVQVPLVLSGFSRRTGGNLLGIL